MNRPRLLLRSAMVIGALIGTFLAGPVSAATTVETVFGNGIGPLGFYAGYSALAIDASGNPHISFVDEPNQTVMYGTKSGGVWSFEPIAVLGFDDIFGDTNVISSIALDSAGNPHIAYWDPVPNVLQYASKAGGVWTIETADNVYNNGRTAKLVIDSNDVPHLAYYDQNEDKLDLKYATKVGGVWTTETVDGPDITGYLCRIAVDASGNPHVSYGSWTTGELKYATKSGGAWSIETVPTGPTTPTSPIGSDITVDASGKPHIAFIPNTGTLATRVLTHATKTGGSWTFETIDPAVRSGVATIGIDGYGSLAVAYFDGPLTRNLRYAVRVGGTWISTVIDAPGDVGRRPELEFSPLGQPGIVYSDFTNTSTKYASVDFAIGFASGTVTAGCPTAGTAAAGVTIDAFAVGSVTLAASTATDASGHYSLTLPSGDYNIVIVTPLGYTATPEEQVVTVTAGQTTPLDFSLACVPPSGDVQVVGFWKHQVGVALGGKGTAAIDADTFLGYLDLIAAHFNSNLVNPVAIYVPPPNNDPGDKLTIASAILNIKGSDGAYDRARQQLFALLLNVASGRLSTTSVVSKDGATASQAITYCDNIIDSPTGDYSKARTIAEDINNGKKVANGMIPLSTVQIAYKRELALRTFQVTPPGASARTFSFQMGEPGRARLNIFDVSGRLVARLIDAEVPAGRQTYEWKGGTQGGGRAGSAVYFARLETAAGARTLKVIQLSR